MPATNRFEVSENGNLAVSGEYPDCKVLVKMRFTTAFNVSFRVKQDICKLTRHYLRLMITLLYPFWSQVK